MAIDLFCYSHFKPEDTENLRRALVKERPDLFAEKFLISAVRDASPMHVEIAADYGLNARSFFLVSLNNKGASNSINQTATALKDKFGSALLILQENEHKL